MHRLILLVSVVFVYTLSLLIANQIEDYYFVFNLCVIPIIASGLFSSEFGTLLLATLCCILGLTLKLAGASTANILQGIFLFAVCALLSIAINKGFTKLKDHKQNTIKLLKEKFIALQSAVNDIVRSKTYLENKVSMISDLYYSVKRMGSCFTFDNLLDTLHNTIVGSFNFKNCKLITLYFADETVKIDKIYQITKEKVGQIAGAGYEEGLLKVILRKRQALLVDIKKGKVDAEEFTFPDGLETFMAAPIATGEKTNAILAAEDIDLEQKDQFVVVANQFSMALERIRLYELVQELAITDGLTGVFVRRHLLERLNEELTRAEHFNIRVAVLMIDVDDFKEYNDKYGHLKGDILLKDITSALKENVRDIDIISRYGGEEFCIVLPDTDSKGAEFVAGRLRESVEALKTTISIGISTYPEDARSSSHLIEKADKMLYKAKQAGKNRVCVYGDRK